MKSTCLYDLYERSRIGKEGKLVATGVERAGTGGIGSQFNKYGDSLLGDEIGLELDCIDSCIVL